MNIIFNIKTMSKEKTLKETDNAELHKTNVITRFFKELFNKCLKCDRLGHKIKTDHIIIRKRSDGYGVCTDFKAKKDYCLRCDKYHSKPYELEELDTFNSVSMPSSYWDSIKEDGYVIMDSSNA